MKFVVLAAEKDWEIISENDYVEWERVFTFEAFLLVKDATAYFNFMEDACNQNYMSITKPVFLNSVVTTLAQIQKNENCIRFNGWQGFAEKPMWEIAGNTNEANAMLLKAIGKTFMAVEDIAGFEIGRAHV